MNYDTMNKEELLTEALKRGLAVTNSNTKAEILEALEDDDTKPVTTKPLPPPAESPLPVAESLARVADSDPAQPFDHEFTDGRFLKRTGTPGEEYALCVHPPNAYGLTHSAKNTLHFWQGTEDQFRLEFDPVK